MNFKTNRPPIPVNAPNQAQQAQQAQQANNPAGGNGLSAQLANPTVNQVSQNAVWRIGNNTTSPKHKFKNWNEPHNHFKMQNGNIWNRNAARNMMQQEHNALHQNGFTNLFEYEL
jgi:hypothetical protein